MTKHRAELVTGSRIGSHGRCTCGRIIESAPLPGTRLGRFGDAPFQADAGDRFGYWRHVSNPTSTMIPAALRVPA